MSILRKTNTLIKTINIFKNWHQILLSYFGFITDTELIYYLRNGIKFKMYTSKYIYHAGTIVEIWNDKVYTPCSEEIKENYIVVDIGAHVGIFSVFAAKFADSTKVFCYEPEPHNFAFLQENIKLNNVNNIIPNQVAITGKPGVRKLSISSRSNSHSLYLSTQKDNQIDVNCITLNELITDIGRCDFLKMDCEGAEYEIILNTPREIINKIGRIAMECHNSSELKSQGFDIDILKSYLEETGYNVSTIPIPYMNGCYLYANK